MPKIVPVTVYVYSESWLSKVQSYSLTSAVVIFVEVVEIGSLVGNATTFLNVRAFEILNCHRSWRGLGI